MRKLFFFLMCAFFSLPAATFAFTLSGITNHGAPAAYFFAQQFDQLVLDVTIPSGVQDGPDKLLALTIKNEWSAQDVFDIRELILWKDAGKAGFQGLGIDQKIGQFIFYSNEAGWYLSDLDVDIPSGGGRFFAAVEISKVATVDRSFQMKIPLLQDQNKNGRFEPGDSGIFLHSRNNGPTDRTLLNPFQQSIRALSVEEFPPKVVITDPQDGATITTSTYKILGLAKDQGGSAPQWVKLAINNTWNNVLSKSDNYATWEYNWRDIAEGTYTLKTQSRDWLDNTGTSEGITVTVAFPSPAEALAEAGQAEEPEAAPAPTEVGATAAKPEPEAETSIEQLQAKIAELKAKIKELLTLLIQLVQAKIAALRSQL